MHCIYKSSKRRPHLQVTKVLPRHSGRTWRGSSAAAEERTWAASLGDALLGAVHHVRPPALGHRGPDRTTLPKRTPSLPAFAWPAFTTTCLSCPLPLDSQSWSTQYRLLRHPRVLRVYRMDLIGKNTVPGPGTQYPVRRHRVPVQPVIPVPGTCTAVPDNFIICTHVSRNSSSTDILHEKPI